MTVFFFTTRHSYGVIPLRKTAQGIECLLINQIDNHKKETDYWTFPKGTPEEGETGLETAVRETKEETGVICVDIDPQFEYHDHYTFTVGLTTIKKTVTYYIGRAESEVVSVQEIEVRDYAWLPLLDARNKLTNDHARTIVDAILTHLPEARLFS
jgi:8-oxo-dGTP pyrophosphatase MutT (NUDIX family)